MAKRTAASSDLLELIGCFCFCSFGHVVLISHKLGFIPSTDRPIPFQSLSNDHVVFNSMHDHPFDGESVSDTALAVIGVMVFVIQL